MNNLEQMKKRKQNLSIIIAILIVLNLLLILVFATTTGNEDAGIATYSGEEVNSEKPVIKIEGNPKIADIKQGATFTVALDSNGNVWSWGQNNKGQLGDGTLNDTLRKQPVLISKDNQLSNVKQIDVGEYHAVALTENNEVYVWGYNYFGQAGSDVIRKELYAQKVLGLEGKSVKQIEAGANFTLALTTSGELFGLGDSSNGQLGYYNTLRFTSIRNLEDNKAEKELSNIKEISAGYKHIVALKNDGTVWTWGDTTGSGFDFTQINKVTIPDEETIKEIQAGNDVSMALSNSGKVYTWSLGGNPTEVVLPTKTVLVEGTEEGETGEVQVKDKNGIAIVNQTYFIISSDGDVYGWGNNNYGQVGNGADSTPVGTPIKLLFDDEEKEEKINHKIDKVSSSPTIGRNELGSGISCDTVYAINEEGYVLGWGYAGKDVTDSNYTDGSNTGKLLGDGTRYKADYIGRVSLKAVAGDDIKLYLKGVNEKNIGDVLDGYVIGGIVNLYNSSVGANAKDSLSIKSLDEDIATYNKKSGVVKGVSQGRTAIEVASPKNTIYISVEVYDNDKIFAKIESQDNYTIALKTDGTVWAWGYNKNLGIIDSEHENYSGIVLPTQIKGLTDVKDISVGNNFVLVLKTDGTVWAWGQNDYGQLGGGTQDEKQYESILTTAPELTQVKRYQTTEEGTEENVGDYNLENITAISAGRYHSLALGESGKVYAWGYNEYGELGLGNNQQQIELYAKEVNLRNLEDSEGKTETIKQIEAGVYTSYILTKTGNIYAFGYNGNAQCGVAGVGRYDIPTKVTGLNSSITKISASLYGNGNVFALRIDGKVLAFGHNYGYPHTLSLEKVVDIYGVDNNSGAIVKLADGTVGYWTSYSNTNITKLQANGEHINKVMLISGGNGFYTVAKTDGTVWTSGTNGDLGKLGNRTAYVVGLPTLTCISYPYAKLNENEITIKVGETSEINATYNYGFNVVKTEEENINITTSSLNESIATVSGNTITAKEAGTTYITAKNEDLGITLRVKVNVLANNEVTMPNISVGYDHTVAVKVDGTVWVWGNNEYGQLGGILENSVKSPEKLDIEEKITDVAAGLYETLMITKAKGKVLAMGYNTYGLGDNANTRSSVPVAVKIQKLNKDGNEEYIDLENIVKVATLNNKNLALDKDGKLYAWGNGVGNYAKEINTFGLKVKDISNDLILTEDGRVWEHEYLNRITFKEGLENIVKISNSIYSSSYSGDKFNMALDAEGNVYTWAYGSDKASGTETVTPTKVNITNQYDEPIKIVDIEAGFKIAYAKDESGNVYTWGRNGTPLGLGDSVTSVVKPTKIEALSNTEVMATSKMGTSYNRTFMADAMGTVYGFGYNGNIILLRKL